MAGGELGGGLSGGGMSGGGGDAGGGVGGVGGGLVGGDWTNSHVSAPSSHTARSEYLTEVPHES